MISRKRSRACASSLAGPCSVSTKPLSEASGVRSSWLALATKSARMRASRSCSLRSRNEIRQGRTITARLRVSSGATVASSRRSTGTRSMQLDGASCTGDQRLIDGSEQLGVAAHRGDVATPTTRPEQILGQPIGMHHIARVIQYDSRFRHGVDNKAPQPVTPRMGKARCSHAGAVVGSFRRP